MVLLPSLREQYFTHLQHFELLLFELAFDADLIKRYVFIMDLLRVNSSDFDYRYY